MSLAALDTVWPADSVEFCPHPDAVDILVCGTYKLEQPEPEPTGEAETDVGESIPNRVGQLRRGKCLLFALDQGGSGTTLQEVVLPAVPDLKWCHRDPGQRPMLAAADTEGHVTLLEYVKDERILRTVQTIGCADSDVLCLSLDWSNRRLNSSDLGDLVVSMSNGSIALLRPENSTGMAVVDTWQAHDFEPWIAAWNYWDTNVIYTGGDDLKMKGWDVRQGFSQPTYVNKRFDAGVTSVQSHPYVEHLLAVGSYNDTVFLFDARKPLVPLTEVNVGGGAWRVKWHPSPERKDDLLVACMHDGCKVLRFNDTASKEATAFNHSFTQRFDLHASMAYGADWSYAYSHSEKGSEDSLIASCSFYDHAMYVWKG
ncbi:WD-40 repeat-containing protein [Trametopsis cervina]|nr:WD-40 repeat-containing protein [Trametopsis cervina]